MKAIEAEESRGKHKDVKDRLIRELSPNGQYVNPLAPFSSEVYGLNLHQLETAEVEQHVSSTPNILLRDYKQFICSKGSGGKNARTAFFKNLQSLLLRSILMLESKLMVIYFY